MASNLIPDIYHITSQLLNTNLEVKSWHWVHVTHIVNPQHFYVRNTEYWRFIEKLEATKPLLKCSSVDYNDIVVFNMSDSKETEKYARGKVVQIKRDEDSVKCDLFLPDYGDIKRLVPIENIWVCDPELRDLPQLSLLCQLANCAPIGGTEWTQKSIDAFKFYVGTERASIQIMDKTTDQLTVELHNTAPDDIATLLALTGYSTFGYVSNDCVNLF